MGLLSRQIIQMTTQAIQIVHGFLQLALAQEWTFALMMYQWKMGNQSHSKLKNIEYPSFHDTNANTANVVIVWRVDASYLINGNLIF